MMRKPCRTPLRASLDGVCQDREMLSGEAAVATTFSGALLGTESKREIKNHQNSIITHRICIVGAMKLKLTNELGLD